ncbi:MAG TPA: tRNA (N(6)-L-threonylcarbamoyladenosine(37)-C(2))-methylthiotransferase MtaB [Deltaproteobacteria bacterium]|nr:tRNA (N(6)-L-threonylcarbamoyladenosine(37)-C(2))-methylthiotransferase MtaB [Deltaproteobacteria bacterium]
MAKIALTTLGCKVNQYETAGLTEELSRRGFTIAPFTSTADVYIINTCTVTAKTDCQSRQLIRRAHRMNPEASIIVTGCYAQTASAELAKLPGVALVVGTEQKTAIPDILESGIHRYNGFAMTDISEHTGFSDLPVTEFPGHTRAFLKIQDGCDAFCSYCIIPYARGRSRSMPGHEVLRRMHRLRNAGYREIVLSGVHLGHWGLDFPHLVTLLDLLRRIEIEKIVQRLRISSIEPTELTDDMIRHIAESELICPHLHIPLQSGDDDILKVMNRHYRSGQFKNIIEAVVSAIPGVAIGIDVMVGFPGEGEREFENTLALIKDLPVAYLHVFPYSARPGTTAATLTGQVPESVKKQRGKILRDLGRKKRIAYNSKFIGKKLSVLVEDTADRDSGMMKGFSRNYIPVLIENGEAQMSNQIVTVIAENPTGGKIVGRKTSHF